MDESTQKLFFASMMGWIGRLEILSDNKLGVIPFRILLKGVIVKPQLYIFYTLKKILISKLFQEPPEMTWFLTSQTVQMYLV